MPSGAQHKPWVEQECAPRRAPKHRLGRVAVAGWARCCAGVPISGQSEYGEACETSADCNPDSATTCLTLEDGDRVCSHRCVDGGECELSFCCGDGYCYPPDEPVCASNPECSGDDDCEGCCSEEGVCLPESAAECGGTTDPVSNDEDDASDGEVGDSGNASEGGGAIIGEGPGLIERPSSGSSASSCSTSTAKVSAPASPLPLVLALLCGLSLVAARRR